MQRRRIVMDLRTSGLLKGVKPCVIYLKNNLGKIYNEGQADFVLTIKNNRFLNFQKLSFFLHRLKPKDDFTLDLNNFKEYSFFQHMYYNTLCIYDNHKRFIEIHYNKGVSDTYPTEDNMSRIIKILEEKGIKEIKLDEGTDDDEEFDTEGKGSN